MQLFHLADFRISSAISVTTFQAKSISWFCVRVVHTERRRKKVSSTLEGTIWIRPSSLILLINFSLISLLPCKKKKKKKEKKKRKKLVGAHFMIDRSIDWFGRYDNTSRVILCLEVRESRSLHADIYLFVLRDFLHTVHTNNLITHLFDP